VDRFIAQISQLARPGSKALRSQALADLLSRATKDEQAFLRALLLRELRQGSLEGSMAEAIATVAEVETRSVLRAVILSGDLGEVAAAFEAKIDEARVQVHKDGPRVAAYTRNRREVTSQVPEVVKMVESWACRQTVVDDEVIALQPGGAAQPFRVTMSRFGTRRHVGANRDTVALTPFFFDCLHLDGHALIDEPATVRRSALGGVCSRHNLTPRIVIDASHTAEAFYGDVLAAGHEGVMVKALGAPYSEGRRGTGWLKVKPAHTLDLVVIAVEWGSGRRTGWLSNLHLGCRDPATGDFVMLGKTFKGLTDETLTWQTERFLDLETSRDRHVVHVRPEQVVEIAFDGIQKSSRYPGGMARRFARVKGYRDDKPASEADTIDKVQAIFEGGHTQ
jgi:DNA ligase-1